MSIWGDQKIKFLLNKVVELENRITELEKHRDEIERPWRTEEDVKLDKRTKEYKEWKNANSSPS